MTNLERFKKTIEQAKIVNGDVDVGISINAAEAHAKVIETAQKMIDAKASLSMNIARHRLKQSLKPFTEEE